MRNFYLILFYLLFLSNSMFSQTTVPDYVTETLKKYHKDKQVGVFTFYNFDEAKKKPNDVIELNLVEQGLKYVPNEIRNFKNIEILDLSYNDIRDLPTWLSELTKLKKLIVNRNKLVRIPSGIFAIKSMEFFNISNNGIDTLDIPHIRTSNLKELDMSFNYLSEVPKSLSRLNTIEILRIRDNKLKLIPDVIVNMKSLKYLSLDNNHIANFDEAVRNATSLRALILTGNKLSEANIKKLRSLLPKCNIIFSPF